MDAADFTQLKSRPGGSTEENENLRIFLIDDSTLVHVGIISILENHPDIELVGYTSDEETALGFCLDSSVDVVVINSRNCPVDVPRLIQRVARIREPRTRRVLLLANDIYDSARLEVERTGVGGVVLTRESPQVIVSALRIVASGYAVSAPGARSPAGPVHQRSSLDLLTLRERQVLALIARGLKNSEIAGELVLSESTIKTHVQNMLTKLGLRNRASAVAVAYEWGIPTMHVSN